MMIKRRSFCVIFKLLIIFFIPNTLSAGGKYTVQVAATKSPVEISEFAKAKKITQPIFEYQDSLWFRYYIGEFSKFSSADSLAKQLVKNTRLKNVQVTVLPEISDDLSSSFQADNSNKGASDSLTKPVETNFESISENLVAAAVLQNPENENVSEKSDSDENIRGLHNRFVDYIDKKILRDIKSFISGSDENIEGVSLGVIFILFVLIFIFNIFIVLFIFFFSNSIQNKSIGNNKKNRELYESVLLSYILGEINWDETRKKLKNLEHIQNRELLSSILINLHENLKGSANESIPEMFVKLGLHHDALDQAKSNYFFVKVKGIRKLTLLFPDGAAEIIPALLNHPDDIIREEAQTAYVRLNPENPFDFLRVLEKPFTRWAQISAFYVFKLHQLPVPSFVKYLDSTHKNVRNFALRMIIYFQQLENTQDILLMLDSPLEQTRNLAIKAINDLRISEGRTQLSLLFDKETEKNKLEIIKAYKNIGDSEDFEFLESIIKADNVTLKLEACRSLFYMSKEGKEKLININEELKNGLEIYIAHINDPRN